MRFHVPQFIEVEDKIFGPLTFKQFIYLMGGGSFAFIAYAFLPKFLAYLVILPIGALAAGLAFYKINGQPLIKVINDAIGYGLKSKLYLWKKIPTLEKKWPEKTAASVENEADKLILPRFTENKLKDLSWSLDIKKKIRE